MVSSSALSFSDHHPRPFQVVNTTLTHSKMNPQKSIKPWPVTSAAAAAVNYMHTLTLARTYVRTHTYTKGP